MNNGIHIRCTRGNPIGEGPNVSAAATLSLEGPGTWFYQTHWVSIQETQVPGSELPGGGQPVFQEFPGDSEPAPAPTWLSSRLAMLEASATRYLRHP